MWVERVTGIEPAQSAWEAETLPLSYTREYRLDVTVSPMLLSDRDIRAEIEAPNAWCSSHGNQTCLQPSSIDVRLDRFFRVFNNSAYTHIDPAQQLVMSSPH